MNDHDLNDIIEKKTARLKDRIQVKDLQLKAMMDITSAINMNYSTLDILEKYRAFVQDQLKIDRLVLFAKYAKWRCLLEYGVSENEINSIDVEQHLLQFNENTPVNAAENPVFKPFDMVVPVFRGDRPLAYLIFGDDDDESESAAISNVVKHLNFLQLLTNIVVSAIENQRLSKDILRREQERRRMMEKQNEILEQQVAERTKELRHEKELSEHLLHNILPQSVADELKAKGSTVPKRYDEVSILFTDFKGFTSTSSGIQPQVLINELNDIFRAFDRIMDKYDMEKIKTIGDAYMAACGVPRINDLHPLQCVRAAHEMLAFLEERAKTAEFQWKMRVGINSGPLIAGVVGTKKFTFDIWGDTVNTASRMESNGEAGRINVSERTYDLIKPFYECEYRGKLAAKGKGEIDMYFVGEEKGTDRFLAVKQWISGKLKTELPAHLSYHGFHHTLDVYFAAFNIGLREKISEEDLELLRTAALLHDSGFTKVYKGHEEVGCELAKENLPGFGFLPGEIEKICGLIMATKVPQNPQNPVEEIICDADLDYLGREDFWIIGQTLFQELTAIGAKLTEKEWIQLQIKFLENHRYFTKTSSDLRAPEKKNQVDKLKEKLSIL
ncbi:MAG: HD domain-containing protein [Bacteroidetes bacterium]|nr:HD domain-containing protein [Bacteroidota bacterium]